MKFSLWDLRMNLIDCAQQSVNHSHQWRIFIETLALNWPRACYYMWFCVKLYITVSLSLSTWKNCYGSWGSVQKSQKSIGKVNAASYVLPQSFRKPIFFLGSMKYRPRSRVVDSGSFLNIFCPVRNTKIPLDRNFMISGWASGSKYPDDWWCRMFLFFLDAYDPETSFWSGYKKYFKMWAMYPKKEAKIIFDLWNMFQYIFPLPYT